jgi:ABC-type Fe3+-hydroxamate transport system substrate-binding protein
MPSYTDQLKRTIAVNKPKRIISLVPSQTELLFDLGLEAEVIGITKFCVHPEKWFRQKQRIGGTKNVSIEKIKSLNPDLIIANKEENVREQVEELAMRFPVWTSDVNTLNEAFRMIEDIGELVQKKEKAKELITQIRSKFGQLRLPKNIAKAAYLIWKDPYMTAGGDTFINDMLSHAGFKNACNDKRRYPLITIEELRKTDCELLFLSSEPYPFKQFHMEELQQHLPQTKICLVDGEMFSWYGSRLLHAPAYFESLHHQINAKL